MKTIWKYPLEITDEQEINVPEKSILLTVQMQYDKLVLWAWVDSENKIEQRKIYVVGTGNPIPNAPAYKHLNYIGTVQQLDGKLIWHIFEG